MPQVAFDISRQIEAPQTVPRIAARPEHPPTRTAPGDDGATALQDRRIAEYEVRLQNRRAQAPVAPNAGYRDPDPGATVGAGLLRGAGYSYLLHPDQVSWPTRLAADAMDIP